MMAPLSEWREVRDYVRPEERGEIVRGDVEGHELEIESAQSVEKGVVEKEGFRTVSSARSLD